MKRPPGKTINYYKKFFMKRPPGFTTSLNKITKLVLSHDKKHQILVPKPKNLSNVFGCQ